MERRAVRAKPTTEVIDASLLTIGLTNLQLDVGVAGFGLRIGTDPADPNNGIRIASLTPKSATPASPSGSRSRRPA